MSSSSILSSLLVGLGTLFWLFYLTWELKHYKGNQPKRWWEKDLWRKRDE